MSYSALADSLNSSEKCHTEDSVIDMVWVCVQKNYSRFDMERETRNCSLFVSHAIQSLCQRLLPSLCTASLLQAIYDIYLAWFGFSVRTEKYEMNEYADYVKTVHTHTNAVRWVSIRHKSSIHDDVRLVFLHAEIYRYMSQHHNIWHTHTHTNTHKPNVKMKEKDQKRRIEHIKQAFFVRFTR